jgi:hypothetical protein
MNIFCCILIFTFSLLKSDIDGTVTPSVVNHKYQFLDGETAKGFVAFKAGFELPINGTIYLDLAPGTFISGEIIFNGGTIDFQEDLSFSTQAKWTGSGFFRTIVNNIIISDRLIVNDHYFFSASRTELIGIGRPAIRFSGGSFNFSLPRSPGAPNSIFAFRDVDLIYDGDVIITTTNYPESLVFDSCSTFLGGGDSLEFLNPEVGIRGKTSFSSRSNNEYIINKLLFIDAGAIFTIESLTRLTTGSFGMNFGRTEFILDNSTLNLTNSLTPSEPITIGNPGLPSLGKFTIRGQSILRSDDHNTIVFPRFLRTQFEPGARLTLENGTHIIVS